jgi:outer membrane protein OmpA-like peptidoglycan-associated protein
LTQKETTLYIQHRLKIAGTNKEIFSPNAIKEIYNFSCGYPRMINIICNHSLLTGYSKGLKSINEFVIRECAAELSIWNYIKEKGKDKFPFSHKKITQKANKTYKLKSGRNGVIFLSVISKEEEDFIKYNLKTLCRVIKQNKPMQAGKEDKFTETPYVIYFKHNSIELLNRKLQDLDKIANYYLKYPKSKISVEGYTDSFGNYWYNKKLTRHRAEIVKNLLIKKGVSPIHIKIFSSELENLISRNVKSVGRKKNYSTVIEFPF